MLVMLLEKAIDVYIIVISLSPFLWAYCMQGHCIHVIASNMLLYLIWYNGNCRFMYLVGLSLRIFVSCMNQIKMGYILGARNSMWGMWWVLNICLYGTLVLKLLLSSELGVIYVRSRMLIVEFWGVSYDFYRIVQEKSLDWWLWGVVLCKMWLYIFLCELS